MTPRGVLRPCALMTQVGAARCAAERPPCLPGWLALLHVAGTISVSHNLLLPVCRIVTTTPLCPPPTHQLCAAGGDLEAGAAEAEGFHDAPEAGNAGSFHSVTLSHYDDASEELPPATNKQA